jgi:glycosyltransferase involved in cell wall biosynthesis
MNRLTGAFITQVLDENNPALGFAAGWVNALAARLARLEVICLAHAPSALAPNVNVSVLPAGRWARYRRVRSILRRLKRGGALDFVLAHMCPSYAVAATLPSKFAPTLLWYAHGTAGRMLRLADRLCDRALTSSEPGYPIRSAKCRVVGQGIDTERFAPPAERSRADVLRLCAVGRITRLKRLDLLINTLERFRERCANRPVACRIVGPTCSAEDEAYAAELKFLVEHKGLEDVIAIEAPQRHAEIAGVYQAADVIVNMTERHSLDKTTLEAMACGCLVLTTNESFEPVLGPHAETMVRPHTSSGGLEGALETLAAMAHDERVRIGLELREIVVRNHGLGRMMDRIIEEIAAVRDRRAA